MMPSGSDIPIFMYLDIAYSLDLLTLSSFSFLKCAVLENHYLFHLFLSYKEIMLYCEFLKIFLWKVYSKKKN